MEIKLQLASDTVRPELFGPSDAHLRLLCDTLDVTITARDSSVLIAGEPGPVRTAEELVERMQARLTARQQLNKADVQELIAQAINAVKPGRDDIIEVYARKKAIEPFTKGQLHYIRQMHKKDLTFCTGPAGTGKTYLAVAVAVSMLKRKQIRKIVLARPAVEAGERLGFLPGDLAAKVNPYLRPLFDSLEDMMEFGQMQKFIEMDIIEVIPLAFMRGRTLNEAVVICDEAQNTSRSQMLMFLTRLGRGSKMIITGDITQTDLEAGQTSGLVEAIQTLRHLRDIGLVELDKLDIVRHSLVHQIVQAYDEKKQKETR